jgi:hypothetical protein
MYTKTIQIRVTQNEYEIANKIAYYKYNQSKSIMFRNLLNQEHIKYINSKKEKQQTTIKKTKMQKTNENH